MNKEIMINAVNDLDDALIIAAAPLAGETKARVNRRRWTRVAAIAACLVVVLGTVAYATGLLDSAFTIYRPNHRSFLFLYLYLPELFAI